MTFFFAAFTAKSNVTKRLRRFDTYAVIGQLRRPANTVAPNPVDFPVNYAWKNCYNYFLLQIVTVVMSILCRRVDLYFPPTRLTFQFESVIWEEEGRSGSRGVVTPVTFKIVPPIACWNNLLFLVTWFKSNSNWKYPLIYNLEMNT